MKRTEEQWQKLYANYKKKYAQLNEKLPGGMAYKQYSYLGYRNAYIYLESTREEQIAKGERKVLNTQRDLINEQKYKYSQDQARAIKQALIKKAEKELDYSKIGSDKEYKKMLRDIAKQFKVKEIRQRPDAADEIYNIAKEMNKELKSQTYKEYDANGNLVEKPLWTSKDRARIIAQTVFGSP